MLTAIEQNLKKVFDQKLVDELLAGYDEAKRNFYLGGLRLSEVEGGRFCEAAFRMLQQATTGSFDPLNASIKSEAIISALAQLSKTHSDSIRIHIPRALRVVYDIRNKRDAAHLADGIDPNLQDAMLVASTLDWIMAEFVRLYHGVAADKARRIIDDLVVRRAPAVQDFDGFLKVLNPKLKASAFTLLLLYERGPIGATYDDLAGWVQPIMRKNLRRTLHQLEHKKAFIHGANGVYRITIAGIHEVEARRLHEA
ncbi:MAG: hypothetical protein Q8P46_13470 [Hyphomicrobiales bacterium]|nr:hypothetical protein [Hyphomicrobiales bacterium]